MNWNLRFASRTRLMHRSAVRELLAVTARPDMISFAGGLPAPEFFPVDDFRAAADTVLSRRDGAALQYGETAGVAELRERIAARFSRPGFRVPPARVLITTGAQQALDLVGRILLDPGDRVLVENPTYLALLGAWRPLEPQFAELPAADHDTCGNALGNPPGGPTPPKLVYVIPNFRNPTGTSLALEHRHALVRECRAQGVVLLEDDPYGELRDGGDAAPSLLQLDAELAAEAGEPESGHVIHCGSFSKTLAPGVRVGWVIAPEPVIDQMTLAKQTMDLHTSTFAQHVVLELLRREVPERRLPLLRTAYRERRLAMREALARHLPEGTTWTRPEGGMFVFVTLAPELDAAKLLPLALRHRVAFVPGEPFHLDGQGRNTLRLNFSHSRPDVIEEGIRRLGRAFAELATGPRRG